jgi:hypothetical protein
MLTLASMGCAAYRYTRLSLVGASEDAGVGNMNNNRARIKANKAQGAESVWSDVPLMGSPSEAEALRESAIGNFFFEQLAEHLQEVRMERIRVGVCCMIGAVTARGQMAQIHPEPERDDHRAV